MTICLKKNGQTFEQAYSEIMSFVSCNTLMPLAKIIVIVRTSKVTTIFHSTLLCVEITKDLVLIFQKYLVRSINNGLIYHKTSHFLIFGHLFAHSPIQ